MSDAIISVVGERVLAILEEQIRYQVNLVRGVEKEVLRLCEKLETIRDVLDDAEKRGVKEQSVKKWLNKLQDTAYQMDDILDEWHYALVSHGTTKIPAKQPKVFCSFIPSSSSSSSSCLCFKKVGVRHNIGIKIQNMKAALDEIMNEKDEFNFVTSLPLVIDPLPQRVQSTSSIELAKVHGQDIHRNKNKLVSRLMMDNGDTELLSIVGMGGLGKTTLAQLVYNDTEIKDCFDLRIWICVSDPFDLEGVARGIVNSVGKETIPQGTNQLELVLEKLRNSFKEKKFLLVLDDVWTEKYQEWEPLNINLQDGAAGSKILVTSRNTRVAKMMGSLNNQIYYPEHLNDEECWSLLRHISLPGMSKEECREFEDVGKKIASKCKGLPLAAIVLGSLLQFKSSLEEWENVMESEIWQLEEAEVDLFPHLLLSYNQLSPSLKRCFSHCGVYPKDLNISAQRLIEEWMALGYLGSAELVEMEVKGRDYLNNLAMRSLFQNLEKSSGDDLIKSCKMHDIVHDFALYLRKNDNTTKTRCQDCDTDPLIVSQAHKYRSLFWEKESDKKLCDCLTSLRVFGCRRLPDGIPSGMEKMIHLRWLDLSHTKLSEQDLKLICRLYFLQTLLLAYCDVKELPVEIGNLVELRRLDLSSNDFKELPESMCGLVELRVLNIGYCNPLNRLPEGMHRLQGLQHLIMDSTIEHCCLSEGVAQLSGLRTLSGNFSVGKGWNKLRELRKLNRLSGLLSLYIKYSDISDLEEFVEDAREAELRCKSHIHTLKIQFKKTGEERPPPPPSSSVWMDVLEALLEPNQNLKKLDLWFYGGSRLPHWLSSPLNFVKHIVFNNVNEVQSLPVMGKLPFLEVLKFHILTELKLVGREFLGIVETSSLSSSSSSSSSSIVAFPKLKELAFYYCNKWSEWEDITAEEEESTAISIMPCLTYLAFDKCEALKKLPHRLLRKASSLQLLDVRFTSELTKRYGDKDGSAWRSVSRNNPGLREC